MIHKQYNEIMANSKKKFSNLYSAIDHGRSKILRTKWKPNVPGNKYYVSRNGKGLVKYKDKFKNYEQ